MQSLINFYDHKNISYRGCIALKIYTIIRCDSTGKYSNNQASCVKPLCKFFFLYQELMGNGSLSEEAMIELMKQQLGKKSH